MVIQLGYEEYRLALSVSLKKATKNLVRYVSNAGIKPPKY